MFNSVLKSLPRKPLASITCKSLPAANFTTQAAHAKKTTPWEESKILITGCQGQLGIPLAKALCREVGAQNVIATDCTPQKFDLPCEYRRLDVVDEQGYMDIVKSNKINSIVHLAGILSALGEKNPDLAVDVNVTGVINAMRAAQACNSRIFVPSSIAVFGGDHFPKVNTPVDVVLQPKTIYGVGKVFNEMIGDYYKRKFGTDFRSLRYPGVISSEKFAFNGTTDYSTEIFFHALENRYYKCPLAPHTALPMIYVDDCIDATVRYLKADAARLSRHVYNLAGISFTAGDFCSDVQLLIPDLKVDYVPDFRQQIAESWPGSIDDTDSQRDWDWTYNISTFDLATKILNGIDDSYKESLKGLKAGKKQAQAGQ